MPDKRKLIRFTDRQRETISKLCQTNGSLWIAGMVVQGLINGDLSPVQSLIFLAAGLICYTVSIWVWR